MPKSTSVSDCMRKNIITIRSDANIAQAIELIVEYKITGLTVLDESGQVVGVLSELDCLEAILSSIYNDGDAEHALVSEAMVSPVETCNATDSIVEVAQSMLRTRQRRRPVVESDGTLVGLVSSNNVLWALLEYSRRKHLGAGH